MPSTAKYAAADLETVVLVDGEQLDGERIREMCADTERYPVSWWREHCEVRAWAWIFYTPDFYRVCGSFDEFCQTAEESGVKHIWFYNAPFDFACFDHAMLSAGWEEVEEHPGVRQFSELCNDFGQRYSMTVCAPAHKFEGKRRRKHFTYTMYDLRNIAHGGLGNLLNDLDVRDGEGKPIRKLEMDYQAGADDERSDDYMFADAAGLWWLIQTLGKKLLEEFGIAIHTGRPDALTASSCAKRYFLRAMYPDCRSYSQCLREFRREHGITLQEDEYFRRHGLLCGGIVLVNQRYRTRILYGKFARYDVNSEYPAVMRDMRVVEGKPYLFRTLADARQALGDDAVCIIEFSRLQLDLLPGRIPAYRHPFSGAYLEEFTIAQGSVKWPHADPVTVMLFEEEVAELANWYEFRQAEVVRVWAYRAKRNPAIAHAIDRLYAGKASAKKNNDPALVLLYKLFLNGFGGKWSQNPRRAKTHREMIDGVVHLVEECEEVDEKSMMQVVQGAYITALGRNHIRRMARLACGGAEHTAERLVYVDTDSLHGAFPDECVAPLVDKYRLGALKRENDTHINMLKVLAPKTYFEHEDSGSVELHTKGIRVESVRLALACGGTLSEVFRPGVALHSESAINVRGGKAILPFKKMLCNPENSNFESEDYS